MPNKVNPNRAITLIQIPAILSFFETFSNARAFLYSLARRLSLEKIENMRGIMPKQQ